MSIRDKMRPLFRTLDGGLFSEKAGKADVGDAVSKLQAEGGTLMCWADPFYPDRVIPQKVLERSVEVIQQGVACHYTPPIGNADLKEVIAKKIERDNHIKVNPQRNIIINPGSDVGLYFAMTPFIEPGDEVLVHDPSYPSNFLDPQLLNGVVVKVPTYEEDNYRLRVEEYEKRLTPKTKMVLLSSPNNPTGNCFRQKDLEDLIARFDGIVVLDEAYAEYSGDGMISKVGEFDNLVVTRTFSKAYAMAALRVGYMASNPRLAEMMGCVKIPYSLNAISEGAAVAAVKDQEFVRRSVELVKEQRPRLMKGMEKLGFETFPSDSNFILARSPIDHKVLVDGLREKGILIRDFGSKRRTENCVRPTVGTAELNDLFLEKADEVISGCR